MTARDSTYERWARGSCPCCGSDIDSWPGSSGEMVQPEAIGEGVTLCGRCIGNNHHTDPPGFTGLLLRAIAEGTDEELP